MINKDIITQINATICQMPSLLKSSFLLKQNNSANSKRTGNNTNSFKQSLKCDVSILTDNDSSKEYQKFVKYRQTRYINC